jgi:tripeptide aminopeptidase
MDITERFLNYTKFDTQSAEDSQSVPSTAKQLVFAEYLKKELEHEGLSNVELDNKGYLYATLKSNMKRADSSFSQPIPTIGFISHYDTSPDCSGADIKPQIVRNYDGSDILLG